MEITLSAVIDAGRLRLAAVTAEVAGYVVLLTIQQVATTLQHVQAGAIWLTDTGDVRVQPLGTASPLEVETELRALLATLIGPSPTTPPALKAAAESVAGAGLDVLRAELHAALVPINHGAARRALARLYRETHRASGAGTMSEESPRLPPAGRGAVADDTPPPPPQASGVMAASKVEPSLLRACIDELDIDVDVVADDLEVTAGSVASSPDHILDGEAPARACDNSLLTTPAPVGVVADLEGGEEHVVHRSDLGELLASFLAHTRSEEQMTEDLRQMLGVASSQARSTPVLDSSDGSAADSRH